MTHEEALQAAPRCETCDNPILIGPYAAGIPWNYRSPHAHCGQRQKTFAQLCREKGLADGEIIGTVKK